MKCNYLCIGFSLVVFSSCVVSKKKFDNVLSQKVSIETELVNRNMDLEKANDSLSSMKESVKKLKTDSLFLAEAYRTSQKRTELLNKEFEQLNKSYTKLLTNSGRLSTDFLQQRDQLLQIQEYLNQTKRQNDSLNYSLLEREKKVQDLERVLANKDKAVQDLKDKISHALLNFKENDLTVKIKNGKVYISLAEQLLFNSGSIEVDKNGVLALQQLAKALKDQKDIRVMVEGHTDNVPISKKSTYMEDNWDLSVLRATSISKILIAAGMLPQQITAAGKGEYSPIAANDNEQNKQKNRRTEIIVNPNLNQLFKILDDN